MHDDWHIKHKEIIGELKHLSSLKNQKSYSL
jgi:hypothetical protein